MVTSQKTSLTTAIFILKCIIYPAILATSFHQAKAADLPVVDLPNMGFGPGIAAIYTIGGDNIESVSVVNDIVRARKKSRARIGPVFEAHYLFGDQSETHVAEGVRAASNALTPTSIIRNDVAIGPTVLVELGENVIRAAGIGGLLSLRKLKFTRDEAQKVIKIEKTGAAFNLGLVGLIEQNAKKLGDGLVDGQPLPAQGMHLERTVYRVGIAVMFSASF